VAAKLEKSYLETFLSESDCNLKKIL